MVLELGRLFLLRRDLKTEISTLYTELMALMVHRDDEESTREEYERVNKELSAARAKLLSYDTAIEAANSVSGTISFKDKFWSLNAARHLKVHIQAELSGLQNIVTRLSRQPKSVKENVWEQMDTPNGVQMGQKTVEHKFIVIPDLKAEKAKMKELTADIQLLDSLIQQADWSTTVAVEDI